MRLEFEPNVAAAPLTENEMFDELTVASDFHTLLKKGISAAQNGDREQARPLLVKAAAYEPRSEDAWMWLASISDYPEELLAFLNNVLNINPENERALEWRTATKALLAKTLVQRGASAHHEGNDVLALQCFEQALVHDNNCEMAWFWKASLAADDNKQLELLHKVLSLNPDNTDAQRALGNLMRARSQVAVESAKAAAVAGKSKLALKMLDEALAVSPDNVDGWVLRSHLSNNIPDKLDALARALEVDPDNAAARSSYEFLASSVRPATAVENEVQAGSDEAVESAPATKTDETALAAKAENKVETSSKSVEESRTEELALATALTEDYETEVPSESFGGADLADSDYAYTNTVTFHAEPPAESADKDDVVAAAFATATTEDYDVEAPLVDIHRTEEPVEEPVDADRVTVDNLSSWEEFAETAAADIENNVAATEPVEVFATAETASELETYDEAVTPAVAVPTTLVACPFCQEPNEPQAFECASCNATPSLSDIESLLANQRGNREVIQQAVTQMEAEWNLREFDQKELTSLALGYFNLRNFESGMKYLSESSRLNPNDVILAGHLNTLAIRLDEIRRQDEVHDSRPVGKTILVVDDSPTVRKLISGKLEKAGHAVVCAVDGVDCLARIEEQVPDLVLLDITMPRMDGYEVCKQIRSSPATKDVPVVMISGKDGFFDKVRGRMAGTTGYITKPFGPETLMKALETYLVNENGSGE